MERSGSTPGRPRASLTGGIDVTRPKWPTAFPPLYDLADDDAYGKALECHLMGYSEYLSALLYNSEGQIPRDLTHVPVKLVEDLKIRIDQTIVECLARYKNQNRNLLHIVEGYYPSKSSADSAGGLTDGVVDEERTQGESSAGAD